RSPRRRAPGQRQRAAAASRPHQAARPAARIRGRACGPSAARHPRRRTSQRTGAPEREPRSRLWPRCRWRTSSESGRLSPKSLEVKYERNSRAPSRLEQVPNARRLSVSSWIGPPPPLGAAAGPEWEAANVTDGWNVRQPDGTAAPDYPPSSGSPNPSGGLRDPSYWWSDALRDPWRDPRTPTAVVVPVAPSAAPQPEPVAPPDAPDARRTMPLLLVVLVTALLAGTLGGGLGFALAKRAGVGGEGAFH